jgi:Na+-driven multidrug efflux pump
MGISPFGGRNIVLVWMTHPRWAFVIHLVFSLILVAALIDLIGRRDWFGAAGLGLVLVMSVGLLAVFMRWAMRRGWRRFTAQEAADQAREAAYKERGLIPPS